MAKISKFVGKNGSVTPSTASLNQKLDTFQTPGMLTPSEIELLRKNKREMATLYRFIERLSQVAYTLCCTPFL